MPRPPLLKYDESQIEKALVDMRNGMNCWSAAKKHGVPRSTLKYRFGGKAKSRPGPGPLLSADFEERLRAWVLRMQNAGFPVRKEQLLRSIQMHLNEQGGPPKFEGNIPGDKWYRLWRKRHPDITIRMPTELGENRNRINEAKIRKWFQNIEKYLNEKEIMSILADSKRIFTCDEISLFTSPKDNKIFASRGDKTVYLDPSTFDKDNLTVLLTCSADGTIASPMIVFRSERIPKSISATIPNNWGTGHSKNGWMTCSSFFDYICDVFNPWLSNSNISKPVILFLDVHAAYMSLQVSEFCNENQIEILPLIPNSALQPIDVSVFRPLERNWHTSVSLHRLQNNGQKLNFEHFCPLLNEVLQNLPKQAIANGFRACGICPFDANAVNYQEFVFSDNNVPNEPNNKNAHLEYVESIIPDEKMQLFEQIFRNEILENQLPDTDVSLYNIWKQSKLFSCASEISDTWPDWHCPTPLEWHGLSESSHQQKGQKNSKKDQEVPVKRNRISKDKGNPVKKKRRINLKKKILESSNIQESPSDLCSSPVKNETHELQLENVSHEKYDNNNYSTSSSDSELYQSRNNGHELHVEQIPSCVDSQIKSENYDASWLDCILQE